MNAQIVDEKKEFKRPSHNMPVETKPEVKKEIINWDMPDEKYSGFTLRDVNTMNETVLKSKEKLTTQEVLQFCHLAKKYQLDPFAKEIWGIKTKSMLSIEASASGWRKIVRRQKKFKRMVLNPWYSADEIEFDHLNGRVTKHIQKGDTTGEPSGAYCMVEYEDGTTNLSIALWEEYGQPAQKKGNYGPYDTPWKYRQEMIKNKASAIFGRTYCGISGLYAEGEVQKEDISQEKKLPKEKGNDAKKRLRNKNKKK